MRNSSTKLRLLIGGLLAVALTTAACGGSGDPLATDTPAPAAPTSSAGGAGSSAAPGSTAGSASAEPTAADTSSAATVAPGSPTSAAPSPAAAPILVGSANFPESTLLANIYAEALRAKGMQVTTSLDIGAREVYVKALQDGSIDLIPDYSGVLMQYFAPDATEVASDEVYAKIQKVLPEGLTVLDKSAAEDKDSLTVTKETADKYKLTTIPELMPVAAELVLGGPSEWQDRPTGVPGLERVYGLKFKEFKVLDTGGPLTINGLTSDLVQAANVFTTDPAIARENLVVLKDPENLFGSQNVVPLITKKAATPEVAAVLNKVSATLTTDHLIQLRTKVEVDKQDSVEVAKEWLASVGLL